MYEGMCVIVKGCVVSVCVCLSMRVSLSVCLLCQQRSDKGQSYGFSSSHVQM